MTTREKLKQLIEGFESVPASEIDGRSRDLLEVFQIINGFGFDLLGMLLPASDAEADLLVDTLITLLLEVRGDDLPPYDFRRHITETTATSAIAELNPGT